MNKQELCLKKRKNKKVWNYKIELFGGKKNLNLSNNIKTKKKK